MDKDYINEQGEIDFDKLNSDERDEYLKMLDLVATSKITLSDFHTHISKMAQSVASTLANEPDFIYSAPLPFLKRHNPKVVELKARLKNYLIFQAFFERPEAAKTQLDLYKKRLGAK